MRNVTPPMIPSIRSLDITESPIYDQLCSHIAKRNEPLIYDTIEDIIGALYDAPAAQRSTTQQPRLPPPETSCCGSTEALITTPEGTQVCAECAVEVDGCSLMHYAFDRSVMWPESCAAVPTRLHREVRQCITEFHDSIICPPARGKLAEVICDRLIMRDSTYRVPTTQTTAIAIIMMAHHDAHPAIAAALSSAGLLQQRGHVFSPCRQVDVVRG